MNHLATAQTKNEQHEGQAASQSKLQRQIQHGSPKSPCSSAAFKDFRTGIAALKTQLLLPNCGFIL